MCTNYMFDYGFGFFTFICIMNITVIYLKFIWQSQITLKFIGNCEGFIGKSENYFESQYVQCTLQKQSQCTFSQCVCIDISCFFLTGVHLMVAYEDSFGKMELFNRCFCFAVLLITLA